MALKKTLPPVPPVLADVAHIDAPSVCAVAGVSVSKWLDLVSKGEAPQRVIRQPRFTRWRMVDVRNWLIARAAQAEANVAPMSVQRAKRASDAAKAKRARA